ncbi:DUF6221 family protein [Lentzea sp. NPDC092896]|uniref:DUF6221 family protein n=1 Tax=Lentzea sp. NPDC092896 TaxID=3364127 RepID=UPI0038077109
MDDLVKWLREQIAEDRSAALLATAGPWRHNPEKHWRKPGTVWCEEAVFAGAAGADAMCIAGTGNSDDPQSTADARHIARHDPRAVLTQCDAHEAILNECVRVRENHFSDDFTADHLAELVVRQLALAYQHHPGYREEWRP